MIKLFQRRTAVKTTAKRPKRRFWRKYHKWVGIGFTLFVVLFCFSGIVLNHRLAFAPCEVSRWWLPKSYHYNNYNNGIVKGTLRLPNGRLAAYGNAGVWLTDSAFSAFTSMNEGLRQGIDHRKISNLIVTPSGDLWCAGLYDVYRHDGTQWQRLTAATVHTEVSGTANGEQAAAEASGELWDGERVADITCKGDTIVVLSRSHVYQATYPYTTFSKHELPSPTNYDPSVSLFRTVWQLHSGELFGTAGRLVVDALGIVLIVLCLTGVAMFFLPAMIRRSRQQTISLQSAARKGNLTRRLARALATNNRWHNRLGAWLIVLTVLLSFTGMCLRPPLMIPFVLTKTQPVPFSAMASSNAWHDKLRSLRWDDSLHLWLLSTSNGFYALHNFADVPTTLESAPAVSPMGITVFTHFAEESCAATTAAVATEQPTDSQQLAATDSRWLVGSFTGLYIWSPADGTCIDYFTLKPAATQGRARGSIVVSGYSCETTMPTVNGQQPTATPIIFDYSNGARTREGAVSLPTMPAALAKQPMSLWNFCLELHVGRCYSPFLGPLSDLFVFIAGLLLTLILLSGYIIYSRR